jgi:hypothetical protein
VIFFYRNNASHGNVIFICYAKNITSADAQFCMELGKLPSKLTHIGCTFQEE